jgi:hypothetical protein
MSSLSHKKAQGAGAALQRALVGGAALVTIVSADTAAAADYFFQPKAEVRVETNTNRDLDVPPAQKADVEAYSAEASATIGIATPRSETTLRPMVRYQDFSKSSQAESVEGRVDLRSRYRTQRATFNVFGRFDHRDTLNSERAGAQGNDLDPNDPNAPETGLVNPGQTRDLFQIRPDFTYRMTQRTGIGASMQYQNVRYSGGNTSRIDYDYTQGRVFVAWDATERTQMTIGPYASTYNAKSGNGADTDAYGVLVDLATKFNERLDGRVSAGYEKDETTPSGLNPIKDKTNGWTASAGMTYQGEISSFSATVSHLLTPSGTGKTKSDQVLVRFTRDLSQRMSVDGGVRYHKNKAVSGVAANSGWKYGVAEVGIEWKMTRNWYVRGGANYERERFQSTGRWANNTSVFLACGYEGLGRQKR